MSEADAGNAGITGERVDEHERAPQLFEPATDTPPPSNEQMLVHFLRHCEARCPACKYNLHGLQSNRCPECGRALVLAVSAVHATPWGWMLTVAAFSLGAGLGVLALIVVIASGDWPPLDEVPVLSIAMAYFIACIPLAIIAMVAKRLFSKLPRAAELAVGVIALFVSIAALVALVVQIFSL